MSERLLQAINELQKAMDEGNVDPRNGLPEELFWFATTLVPCANIDLFTELLQFKFLPQLA